MIPDKRDHAADMSLREALTFCEHDAGRTDAPPFLGRALGVVRAHLAEQDEQRASLRRRNQQQGLRMADLEAALAAAPPQVAPLLVSPVCEWDDCGDAIPSALRWNTESGRWLTVCEIHETTERTDRPR